MKFRWGSKEINRIEKLHQLGIITSRERDERIEKQLLKENGYIEWSWVALFATVVLMGIMFILKIMGRI